MRRFDVRLVTIEAGAGFGKTTLLAQGLTENELAPRGTDVWLACEPADSSPSVLLGAVLDAIGRPPDGPPTVHDVCEAVWSMAPEQVCLVFDDVHHVEAGSKGAAALQQLLVELPENAHVVLVARRLPDVSRSRLSLHRHVLELAEQELTLTPPEADALARVHHAAPDVVRKAGGWPALAELYARVGSADARRFVWEEVVEPLDDAHRHAFLFLVAVGSADADALAVVTEAPIDGSRLAGLPLVAVDTHGGLRPDPLWRELLAERIDATLAGSAGPALAEVFAARGQHCDAFELLAEARSWDRALDVLFEACNDLDQPPWPDQMQRWAGLLPAELAERPEVAHLRGTLERAGDGWSGMALAAFTEAAKGFRGRGDSYREILAAVRVSQIAWLLGDAEGVATVYRRGSKLLDQGWPIGSLLTLNVAAMADIEGRTNDVLEATCSLTDVEPRLRHFGPLLRVFAHLAAGDADCAVDDVREAAASASPTASGSDADFEATCLPAMVAWGRGDLDAALALPLDDPGPRQSLAERVPTLALGAVVAAHVGEVTRASALVSKLDALVPDIGDRHLLAGYRAIAGAALAIARGDEPSAVVELTTHLDGRELAPVTAGRAIRWLPALPYLFHERARALLDELPAGASRRRTLEVCRALLAARRGSPWTLPATLDDPDALLTILPVPLAAELVVRAAARHRRNGSETIARLARRAPDATRRTLRSLANTEAGPTRTAAATLLRSVPIPPGHTVRIEVLGSARFLVDGEPVDDPTWRRQRVRHLVCALVAHDEIRRARLSALLWPEFDEAAASANLRMTLSRLQSLLEPERTRGDASWFVRQDLGVLRLAGGDHLSVDAWELESHLGAALRARESGAPSIELDHLSQALDLWRGEYLDDVAGEEWAEPLCERMRRRFVAAAVRAGELLVAAARPAEAIRAADAAIATDRWCEAAYRVLASAYTAAGDADAARQATDACERRLAELGIPIDAGERR